MELHEQRQLEDVVAEGRMPIGSNAHLRAPVRTGVVMMTNVPYTLTRQEVIQFFGRDARLAPECPVHIIMERSTGKTEDVFVEFYSLRDAEDAVRVFNRNMDISQGPRIGARHVEVSLVDQTELMKAIFPLTKGIDWVQGRPVQDYQGWSHGVSSFLTDEEMFCSIRHAEMPNRSIFATKVPQRTYEFMISTVWKFPWYAINMYTIKERNKVFQALRFMIEALVNRMRYERVVGLDGRLVLELVHAGLMCPAFNPRMKFTLAYVGEDKRTLQRMSEVWLTYFPFDALTWLPPHDPTALQFYAALISKAYVASHEEKGLMQRWNNEQFLELYGRVWFEWEEEMLPTDFSYADCVNYEKSVLRSMLISGYKNHKAELEYKKSQAKAGETGLKSGSPTPTMRSMASQISRPSSTKSVLWKPKGNYRPPRPKVPPVTSAQVPRSDDLDTNFEFPTRGNSNQASGHGAQNRTNRGSSHQGTNPFMTGPNPRRGNSGAGQNPYQNSNWRHHQ